MRNGDFSQHTIRTLYKRAGEHCTICKKITSKPHADPERFHNLGEAAHINGLSDAPNLRYDPELSKQQLSNIRNGIWLCLACHHEIDADERTFHAERLRDLKRQHEELLVSLQTAGTGFLPALAKNQAKINGLQQLIDAKEEFMTVQQVVYDQELNKLKFELDRLNAENVFLKSQESTLKRDVLELNHPEINKALISENGIDKVLSILSETALDDVEIKLVQSRLLRAKLLTAKGDFQAAGQEYERLFMLRPCTNVALSYISFLYFYKIDYEKVIEIAARTHAREQEPGLKADVMAQQAQAMLKLGRHEDARKLLTEAKQLIEDRYTEEVWAVAKAGKLDKHIGDCYKLNLQYEAALKSYELALNKYFYVTVKKDEYLTVFDMAGLASAIGLLYERNNLEEEAIIHHLRAVDVLRGIKKGKDKTLAIIYMNVATCYMQRKTLDLEKAVHYAQIAHRMLTNLSKESPRNNMEYLLGAKCLLADLSLANNQKRARRYYNQALRLADMLVGLHHAYIPQKVHVLHNYAVFCIHQNEHKEGLQRLDEAILLLEANPSSKMEHVVVLTKAYILKLQFAENKQQRISILQTIVKINEDTPKTEKTFAYKYMAEEMLAAM